MLVDNKAWRVRFFRHMRHWSWFFFINQYDADHLIVADDFFLHEVENSSPRRLKCKLASLHAVHEAVTDEIEKILVFCQQGEMALVRELQARYPDKTVVSGTYTYALTGPDRSPRMLPTVPYVQLDTQSYGKPVFILSTAYADAEFIAQVFVENGLPLFHEHLGRLFVSWLSVHQHFQVSRFYDAAQRRFSRKGHFFSLLQIDVLQAVFDNTPFKLNRFIRFLEQSGAKVILVSQDDHITQSVRAEFLDQSIERSVWTQKTDKKRIVKTWASGITGWIKRCLRFEQQEHILNAVEDAGIPSYRITLEAFLQNQELSIREMADFIGFPIEGDITVGDYSVVDTHAPTLQDAVVAFRREMIDRLGINMS
ncbi:hypothetical protein [Kordiimonas pumila]|uniref:Uncharacterized protein n=1 Tax=Kordiimonas pumila TaxID=2161677 RepID=A0ABV7D3H2_9PROT|nr:hypothetical protein [Kordiimonas pumila]